MARTSNHAERHAQIVSGAIHAIASHGYSGATTRRIAEYAGISHGIIHYSFRDKDEVMTAVCAALAARIEQRYAQALRAQTSPLARIDAVISAYTSLSAPPAAAHAAEPEPGEPRDVPGPVAARCWSALVSEAAQNPGLSAEVSRWLERSLDELETIYTELGAADPGACAATVMSAIQGAIQLGSIQTGLLPAGFAHGHIGYIARALIASTVTRPKPDEAT